MCSRLRDRTDRARFTYHISQHFRWQWRTPNPVFKVIAFLKSNIRKTVRPRDNCTRGNYTYHMEWYYVWWPWLTSKCVARVCQHQLSFLFYCSKGRWRCWRQLKIRDVQSSSQIVIINKLTPSFLQAGCPSCRPTNSVKALKGKVSHSMDLLTLSSLGSSILVFTTEGSRLSWRGGLPNLSQPSDTRPRAGSRVERIDPLHFLAGCRKRWLNWALSVLSLSLDFWVCLLCC